MIFRNVTMDMVKETIISPDRADRGYADRYLAFKRYGNHHVVITVIWAEG